MDQLFHIAICATDITNSIYRRAKYDIWFAIPRAIYACRMEISMEEIYSKVVAIIIGCIALFIVPVKILSWRQDNMQQTYILTETICFVDSVCNKGILYSDLYIDYLNKIQKSDKIYKIKLQHIKNSKNNIENSENSSQNPNNSENIENSFEKINSEIEDIDSQSIDIDYTEQILEELKTDGSHKFLENDIFRIEVVDNSDNVVVFYGGCIKDEDY
jgi:hypothetical protein